MKMHKFNLVFLATSVAMMSQVALADPATYTHLNGSTVVNINKADTNGLSHNMWSDFNVSDKGMVLNNSTADLIRDSGNIAKNNNLDAAAKVILNEVISNKASTLKGFIEVGGTAADVIIANPNGITCTGCSFVNASRATLTTGTPVLYDGALTGFNVQKGTVTVNGSGLTNTDSYTDILAENVRINGQITSGTLRAIAGKYTYDSTTDMVTADGSHAFLVNGIDVSALGGVTAGVILLQSTKTGVGVNNNGTLTADNMQISTNGTLINSGSLKATTNLIASSGGTLTNSGSMTGTNIQLVSSGDLNNNGTVNASAILSAAAGSKISNSEKATLNATTTNQLIAYKGDIENKGTISSDGTVYLRSGYTSDADNALTAVANTKVTNTGTISGKSAVSLLATDQVNLNSGSVSTEGTAYVVANTVKNATTFSGKDITVYSGSFENTSTMTAEDAFVVTGLNSITNYGTLKGNTLALNTNGKINNKTCSWLVLCTSGTLSADTSINITAPTIASVSDIAGNIVAPTVTLNATTTE